MIRQQPPGENPSISVIFAEPPSVEGIAGGQMVEEAAGAAVVLLAACVELSSPSPGSSRGVCELREEEDALIPLVLPAAGPIVVTAPLTLVLPLADDPPVVAVDVPEETDEVDGSGDVGMLSGPPGLVVVWACAAAITPRQMIAVRIVRCIAFSCCIECEHTAAPCAHAARQRLIHQKRK